MTVVLGFAPDGAPVRLATGRKVGPPQGDALPAEPPEAPSEGAVVARLARLGVVDLQGDIVEPGCLGGPAPVVISGWNHSAYQGAIPVGTGTVAEEGGYLVLRGRLLLATQGGREVHEVLRALGPRGRWSWGFSIVESRPDKVDGARVRRLVRIRVSEASPVLSPASIGSGTVEVRGL